MVQPALWGIGTSVYEHVFELLLRLKGNYLWPAMWSARFGDDGPGLANAKLADEYGIIMGMSHHEPCLRQGEEYKYLREKIRYMAMHGISGRTGKASSGSGKTDCFGEENLKM